MLTTPELVWLLAAVAKGDQAAFERLYQATRAKLYGVALRILRRADLADEVIQEAYLKVWNSARQFDPAVASPITWMVAIARNRAIDLVRKKSETSIEDQVRRCREWGERNGHEPDESLVFADFAVSSPYASAPAGRTYVFAGTATGPHAPATRSY